MIERFWIIARLVCSLRGHRDEVIGSSTLHPIHQCRRCFRTRRV